MKIRCDFVSNSSSSSFVFYGTWIKNPDVEKYENEYDYIESLDLPWQEFTYKVGQWGDDCIAVGIDIGQMKDDETLKQFKERVAKSLNDKIPELKKLTTKDITLIRGIDCDGNIMFDE